MHDIDIHGISRMHFLYLESHCSARLSFHPVTALLRLETLCRHSVNRNDLITALKAVFLSRRTCIRLVYYDIFFLFLVDDGTYASIGLGHHHLEVFILFLRNIDSVRIKTLKHGVDPCPHDSIHRK